MTIKLTHQKFISLFLTLQLFAVIGCGSKENPPDQAASETETQKETIDQALGVVDSGSDEGSNVLNALSMEDSIGGMSQVSALLGKLKGFCSPTLSGDQTDADQDRIKKDSTASFDCKRNIGKISFEAKGSLHVKDEDDSVKAPLAGFSLEAPNTQVTLILPNSKSVHRTSSTKVRTEYAGEFRNFSFNRKSSIQRGEKSHEVSIDIEGNYHPEDPSKPRQSGTLTLNAHFVVKGEKSKDVTLAAKDLLYSEACAPKKIKEGVIKISSADGKSKEIIIENCKVKR